MIIALIGKHKLQKAQHQTVKKLIEKMFSVEFVVKILNCVLYSGKAKSHAILIHWKKKDIQKEEYQQ